MRECLNLQQQLQHCPKSMLALTNTESRENLIPSGKQTSTSGPTACLTPDRLFAAPVPSAPPWHNSKFAPSAPILPVVPAPHNTQREAGEPQPSAVSPGQAGAQGIPMKSLQQPSGSCWSMEEFLLGHKAPSGLHTWTHTCCWGFTAHFTAWHRSGQNWPCTKEGEWPSLDLSHRLHPGLKSEL